MAVAFVQGTAVTEGLEVSSFAPSITGVTAGNLIVCLVSYVPSGTANTACPTPSGGWSVAEAPTSTFGTAYAPRAAIFYKQNASAGTHTATFSLPAGSYIAGKIVEFSGVSTSAALDVHANTIGTHATTGTAGPTSTSTVADSVAVCQAAVNGFDSGSAPTTGYTDLGAGSDMYFSPGYKILSATATQSATWTWTSGGEGTTGDHALVLAVFKADSGGGGGTELTPGAGALVISGHAPTVARTAHVALTPAAAGITLAGAAPTVTQSANQSLTPGVASVTLAGPAPTVARTAHQSLQPGAAAIALQGHAPTVAQQTGLNLSPIAAALVLQGLAPTIAQTAHVELSPAPAHITMTGHAPQVVNSGAEPAPAGGMGFEMGGKPSRVREVYLKPLLQRVFEARQEKRVKPRKERPAARAKAIEVQAAQMLLADDATPAEFGGLLKAWQMQAPAVPSGQSQESAFMAQIAFRIEQMGEWQRAQGVLQAQRRADRARRDEDEAAILLLLAD